MKNEENTLTKDFLNFIFGSEEEAECFISYQDNRFNEHKTKQIKSLFMELKEDKWNKCWRNLIPPKMAFALGDYDHYLTQGYQKHIHNITKKFVNLNGELTFYVSTGCLESPIETLKPFVDEHRENQYKILNHIMGNSEKMNYKEFFDLLDEARKCNIVTVSENTRLQEFQLLSKPGEWKEDYKKANVKLINMCNTKEVLEYIEGSNQKKEIIANIRKLRKRNFSGTKEILDSLLTIIDKRYKADNE